MKSFLSLFLILFLLQGNAVQKRDAQDPIRGKNGMVVSAERNASEAGVEVLKKGGNAVDAAVATGFALAVTFPIAGNIGGGGFMVIRNADGTTTSFDYREKAPAAAFRDMYLDAQGNFVPALSQKGHLAAGVPGSVAGMVAAHQKYGKLPLAEVLKPAVRLAERGYPLTEGLAGMLNAFQSKFAQFPSSTQYFTKATGQLYQEGDRFVQRDLAQVLKRIQRQGRDGFYEGITADLIVQEMRRGNGIITHQDLSDYQAVERTPITGTYRGYKIISMAPPSSGGIALMQLLNQVEPYDLKNFGLGSSDALHLSSEAMRRVYADRAEWLGDPDFVSIPQAELLSKDYAKFRMRDFNPDKITPSNSIRFGNPVAYESTETTHYSVVDKDGNAVSVTTTINGAFGNFVAVGGAGFMLNNEMDDFSAKPGTANMFGLVGNEANAIQPHKRMLSSMTPTIVENPEGKLFMVLGSPGGSTIITTVFQTLTNVIDFGLDIQEAVNYPRFHHQWLPADKLFYEKNGFPKDVLRNLEAKGWQLSERKDTSGQMDAIMIQYDRSASATDPSGLNRVTTTQTGRTFLGAPDPRGENHAATY